jgi:hypothetical protein
VTGGRPGLAEEQPHGIHVLGNLVCGHAAKLGQMVLLGLAFRSAGIQGASALFRAVRVRHILVHSPARVAAPPRCPPMRLPKTTPALARAESSLSGCRCRASGSGMGLLTCGAYCADPNDSPLFTHSDPKVLGPT